MLDGYYECRCGGKVYNEYPGWEHGAWVLMTCPLGQCDGHAVVNRLPGIIIIEEEW